MLNQSIQNHRIDNAHGLEMTASHQQEVFGDCVANPLMPRRWKGKNEHKAQPPREWRKEIAGHLRDAFQSIEQEWNTPGGFW